MTSYLISALVAAGLATSPSDPPSARVIQTNPAVTEARGACDRAVEQAIAMTGGELLSVQPARNGRPICRVIVLVVKPNGRPQKIKLRIPMDF